MRAGSRRGSADGLLVEQFVITFAVSTEFDEPERILRKRKEGPRQANSLGEDLVSGDAGKRGTSRFSH